MDVEPVDLRASVQETVDILQKTLPENIALSMDVAADEYVVNADPTRIQQVLMNLVLNARDAMPEGGELRIGLVQSPGCAYGWPRGEGNSEVRLASPAVTEGEWIRLSVSDNGTGMTDAVRAHIFEPFFTTKGLKGTGLGLAQVYGIVKQHGGEIDVQTELGCGTTFYIDLPAYQEEFERKEEVATAADFHTGRPWRDGSPCRG